ncbi:unnamed protein product [Fusarium graminearum]|nr:unnamed protein product [Fusarium graminearum]
MSVWRMTKLGAIVFQKCKAQVYCVAGRSMPATLPSILPQELDSHTCTQALGQRRLTFT